MGGATDVLSSPSIKQAIHAPALAFLRSEAPLNRNPNASSQFLVNELTVKDARHLLNSEGGALTARQCAFQLVSVLVVAGLCARAIVVGNATVWHLVLPMIAEYLVILVAIPISRWGFGYKELRKESRQSLAWLVALPLIAAGYVFVKAQMAPMSWTEQFFQSWNVASRWITDAGMHWPILGSVANAAVAFPRRLANLRKFGPPFVAVSIGCAMRFVLCIVVAFLMPFILANPDKVVWVVWAVVLAAELLALWFRVDVQRRLKKLDAESVG
jgi:hypothetical protein